MSDEILEELRRSGWSVAVHNDYRLAAKHHTFWLFTHPSGLWAKGEGPSDAIALANARDQARARVDAQPRTLPVDRMATLDEVERAHIAEVMRYTNGNRKRASEILGIGERTLYRRLEAMGPPRHRDAAVLIARPDHVDAEAVRKALTIPPWKGLVSP